MQTIYKIVRWFVINLIATVIIGSVAQVVMHMFGVSISVGYYEFLRGVFIAMCFVDVILKVVQYSKGDWL